MTLLHAATQMTLNPRLALTVGAAKGFIGFRVHKSSTISPVMIEFHPSEISVK
jgi:hypothetical protein